MATSDTMTGTSRLAPGTGHVGQEFLVGDQIYIRAIERSDAKRGQSLANGIFPRSPSRWKTTIKDELPKQGRNATYTILRKVDDVPVGAVRTSHYDPKTRVTVSIDPLYGDIGLVWKAEAYRLVIPWLGDEQHRPNLHIMIPADEPMVADALGEIGAVQTARYRELYKTWGGRTDGLVFAYLNPHWVERLGDPATIEPPRSGTGEARPVPAPVMLDGDPPANAVKVGARVYLRPLTKADASLLARWSRQDTETFWDAGRFMYGAPGLAAWHAKLQKDDPVRHVDLAACLRETDELIGVVGFYHIDYVHGHAESGSQIYRPEYRGGGYGSEAKHLLFDYAFNDLQLHTLYSTVIFPNTRSAAALRKQGYRDAGRLYWDFASHGSFENFLTFDLLASDWRAMPRSETAAEGERAE